MKWWHCKWFMDEVHATTWITCQFFAWLLLLTWQVLQLLEMKCVLLWSRVYISVDVCSTIKIQNQEKRKIKYVTYQALHRQLLLLLCLADKCYWQLYEKTVSFLYSLYNHVKYCWLKLSCTYLLSVHITDWHYGIGPCSYHLHWYIIWMMSFCCIYCHGIY